MEQDSVEVTVVDFRAGKDMAGATENKYLKANQQLERVVAEYSEYSDPMAYLSVVKSFVNVKKVAKKKEVEEVI